MEHTFNFLGESVTVELTDASRHLVVYFGPHQIADESGEIVTWPYLGNVHGAALKAVENKVLRELGETAIRDFIHHHAESI